MANSAEHGHTQRYAIDVRVFLATVTIAMVVAFGMGVAVGPDGSEGSPVLDLQQKQRKSVEAEWQYLEDKHVSLEDNPNIVESNVSVGDDGEEHQPAGQHLLVDIKGVDADFLDSEERLAQAMVDAVKAGGLSLLSYHCHKLSPSGVSCVGVLLESHISFHTWPEDKVITLDLFTCGPKPLMPVIPKLEELFGVGDDPVVQWSHELRGFRHNTDSSSPTFHLENDSDLAFWVLSPLDMHLKKEVFSAYSDFQRIDIWDVLEIDDVPNHEDAQRHNLQPGDPRWLTPEVASPDRYLFLDGTLQSMRSSQVEYHEALTHPAMFAHPNPKTVAILGGGEGATLREVLKHKTLETAIMLEIDELLIKATREHMPFMSNCSNYVGLAENCFDDEKAQIVITDARQWFVDRYSDTSKAENSNIKFDVIVMDALDPEDPVSFSGGLYNDVQFVNSLMNALSDEGVMVIQVGTAPNIHDPRADMGVFRSREILFNLFEANEQVEAMLSYEEAHCGFFEPHSFLLVCKSADCRSRWHSESDVVDYQIYDRIVLTHSGDRALEYYDGSTQHSYRYPPKAWETVYCRREPEPFECAYRHLDPTKRFFDFVFSDDAEEGHSKEESAFEVKLDDEGPQVYALVDIPKGSYIMPHHLASSFQLTDKSLENLQTNSEVDASGPVMIIKDLVEYVGEYGHNSTVKGMGTSVVEIGVSAFIRESEDESVVNIARWVPPHPSGETPIYSPVYERHRLSFDVFIVASKNIAKGEELMKPMDLWD